MAALIKGPSWINCAQKRTLWIIIIQPKLNFWNQFPSLKWHTNTECKKNLVFIVLTQSDFKLSERTSWMNSVPLKGFDGSWIVEEFLTVPPNSSSTFSMNVSPPMQSSFKWKIITNQKNHVRNNYRIYFFKWTRPALELKWSYILKRF